MNELLIDLGPILGPDTGVPLPFERTVARPRFTDFPNTSDLAVQGTVERLDAGWLVRGTVTATMQLSCSRCLREFTQAVRAEFAEPFRRRPATDEFKAEETRLDLSELLRSALLLAVPDRPLHDPECRGLCPVCGKDLNDDPHDHPDQPSAGDENPFSVLKRPRG